MQAFDGIGGVNNFAHIGRIGKERDFLEKILNVENDARLERQRTALMKLATLPSVKTIEQYDFAFASGAPRAQIQELAALTFIERAERCATGSKWSWQESFGASPGLPCCHGGHQDAIHHGR